MPTGSLIFDYFSATAVFEPRYHSLNDESTSFRLTGGSVALKRGDVYMADSLSHPE